MEAEVETLTSRKLDFSRSNNSNLELQGWRQAFPRRFLFTLLSTDAGSRDTCTARFHFPLCLLNARKAAFETPQELIGLQQQEIPRWCAHRPVFCPMWSSLVVGDCIAQVRLRQLN
jgi:hypothetical protein